MGLFKSANHPAKTDPAERALSLSLRPSPGANHPMYPSFPALASRILPEGRIPKGMKVFFFSSLFLDVKGNLT